MSLRKLRALLCVSISVLILASASVHANDNAKLEADRAAYRAKKIALIEKALALSPNERAAFWPEYFEYEAELKKLYDERYSIIRDYAANYNHMNNEIADSLVQRSLKLREDRADLWRRFYYRIKKSTSAIVAGQFLQIENELNLLSDLKISQETATLGNGISSNLSPTDATTIASKRAPSQPAAGTVSIGEIVLEISQLPGGPTSRR